MVTAWAAAWAFEAAIVALSHKLAKHIETTPRYTAGRVWPRPMSHLYPNACADGLLVTVGVSVRWNTARFFATPAPGRTCVCGRYDVRPLLHSPASGGILPPVSLMFARILANTADG